MIPFSTFSAEKKVIPFGDDEVIVLLAPNEKISFFGKVQLRVHTGAVKVYGHVFKKSPSFHPLYAPYTAFCHTLFVEEASTKLPPTSDPIGKAIDKKRGKKGGTENESVAVIVLKPQRGDLPERWFERPRAFDEKLKECRDPFLIPGFHPLLDIPADITVPQFNEPIEYVQVARLLPAPDTLKSSNSPFTILVCGPTHSGKSSFCRYLVNKMLNIYDELFFLEADVGQTEFTAPGHVSLNLVKEPLSGPPFTHVATPVKNYYLGDTSPARNPKFYTDAFCALVDFYHNKHNDNNNNDSNNNNNENSNNNSANTHSGVPLIINTCGWVTGLGQDLLVEQVKYAQPDIIINMRNPIDVGRRATRKEEVNFLTPEFLQQTFERLPRVIDIRVTTQAIGPKVLKKDVAPADNRLMQMLSYFQSHSSPVTAILPYSVPWNKIRIIFTEPGVPPSQTMYALNGTVVGLCIDSTPYTTLNPDECSEAHLYPEFVVHSDVPICECVGTGIIRSIDPTTRVFFVIVPPSVSPERLQKVNTFVRGSIPTPIPLSLSLTSGHRVLISAPYTATYTANYKIREAYMAGDQTNTNNAPAEEYGPDTEIITSSGGIENRQTAEEERGGEELDQPSPLPTSPSASPPPAKTILTPSGPKSVAEIGLEEEMELLEQNRLKNSPNKAQTQQPSPSSSTKTKTSSKIPTPQTTPKASQTTPKASQTAPKAFKTTPKETPKETTPKETPKETTPKETTSKETTLKETTLKATTPKASQTTPKASQTQTTSQTTPKTTSQTTPKTTSQTTPKTKTTPQTKNKTTPQTTPKTDSQSPSPKSTSQTSPKSLSQTTTKTTSPTKQTTKTISPTKTTASPTKQTASVKSPSTKETQKRKIIDVESTQEKKKTSPQKKQKQQQQNSESEQENETTNSAQMDEEEEEVGRFVRNPIFLAGDDGDDKLDKLQKVLEQQEREWGIINDEEQPEENKMDPHVVHTRPRVSHKAAAKRAIVLEKRRGRRKAPINVALEIVGKKQAKHIPR